MTNDFGVSIMWNLTAILKNLLDILVRYQIDFYYGNSNIFAGSCVFVRSAQQDSNVLVPVQGTGDGVPISANSRLSGILTSNGGGRTASVKLYYHVY